MNLEGMHTRYIYSNSSMWKTPLILGNSIGNNDYFLTAKHKNKTATASPTTSIWECNYLGDDGIGNDDMGMVQVTALGQIPPA